MDFFIDKILILLLTGPLHLQEVVKAMCDSEHAWIERHFEYLSNRKSCEWCQHPECPVMPKIGLCRHCNRIRLELSRLEKRGITGFSYQVAQEMKASAITEGMSFGLPAMLAVSSLRLEHALRDLGRYFVRKEFFVNDATHLGNVFCPIHRQYVFYMLSLYIREYLRKNRRQMASYPLGEDI